MNSSSNSDDYMELLDQLERDEQASLLFDWRLWAEQPQLEPEGDWTTWLMVGGRGAGKTRAGAEWVRSLARAGVTPIALVGQTMTEAIAVMVRGESGLLNIHPQEEQPVLRDKRVIWPNGVEAWVLSAANPEGFRGPQFAAAWSDELGCGAVDKGANQPNIFGDDKSAEGGRPYFSSGLQDPLIQRQVLRAHQAWWGGVANNPAGMVDRDRIYHWTWDARPYPAFPALTDVWADGVNHRTGHWLTGRLGGMASDELAVAIGAAHDVDLSAEPALPFVSGYTLGAATTAREALEPVIAVTGQGLRSRAGGLHLGAARHGSAVLLEPDELAQGEGPTLSRRRGDPAEAPGRLALSYVDRERDYLTGTVTALSRADGPLAGEAVGLVLDGSSARLSAERVLDGRSGQRETLDLELPPSARALEPGDLVEIAGLAEGPFEIAEIRDGLARRVTARTLAAGTAMSTGVDRPMAGGGSFARSLPVVTIAHLPPLPADPGRSRLVAGGYAAPWPGGLQLVDDTTGATVLELGRRGLLGTAATPLQAGPVAVWDIGRTVDVTLHAGHLASAEPLAVLAGSNRMAIENDAGGWEVIGFTDATLVSPGLYRLSGLLRGLEGTGPSIGPVSVGRRVMILDARVGSVPVEAAWLGETRDFRVYAGSSDVEGTAVSVGTNPAAALPLPPVHLRARRGASGDIALNWVRCSRADGEAWGAAESPLEHVPERYRLIIFDGATVVRTLDINSATATYASAEQLADFGTPPSAFIFTVAQLSPVLGAGHAASGEFNG